ncbi:MAG: hypothetical protein HFI16_06905 [Lachnospiraceae bacterium]|nr:hypothetical protein [Lachnospiraceae bacterium]
MLEKLIVMLTHNDVTVKNAKELFEGNRDLPVVHWGFKDVGLEPEKMKELCRMMKAAGKTTYLEVVTYSEEECMRGAKLAVECGFDCLLGTIFYESVAAYVKTTNLKYYPFVGKVSQSPSILEGSCDYMLEQTKKYQEAGACGVDLLGYRYVEGDPNVLSAAYIKAGSLPTVLAGSIGSEERMLLVKQMDPAYFTMGSALFTKNFVKDGSFRDNLKAVVEFLEKQ